MIKLIFESGPNYIQKRRLLLDLSVRTERMFREGGITDIGRIGNVWIETSISLHRICWYCQNSNAKIYTRLRSSKYPYLTVDRRILSGTYWHGYCLLKYFDKNPDRFFE